MSISTSVEASISTEVSTPLFSVSSSVPGSDSSFVLLIESLVIFVGGKCSNFGISAG
jgi:hypothetical protein